MSNPRSAFRFSPSVVSLESREVPAVTAVFNPGAGALTVFGDSADNQIVVSRDALGVISVNGQVPLAGNIPGGFPSVFNTRTISVFGQGGNDAIRMDETNGPLPAAQLFGGSGNDTLIGGSSNDALHGQDGNDTLIAGGGDDFVLGQSGNDVLLGGDGVDQMFGGAGDDFAAGQVGDDVAFLGAGDDTFGWLPGEGSDRVEGEGGFDTMAFIGSNGDEVFEATANGGRLRFTRDVGDIVMDVDGIETVDLQALDGADTVTVNDLTGTAVTNIDIDLGATAGGAADDQTDRVILNGTGDKDDIDVVGFGTLFALGLPTLVTIDGSNGSDEVMVNALDGDDRISASSVGAGLGKFTFDGGAGDDVLSGTNGEDVLLGGAGDDFAFGNRGNDVIQFGDGDDIAVWRAGDGNDVIDGGAGRDALTASGSTANEVVELSAAGDRFRLTRDVDNVTVDAGDLESFSFFSFGGSDTITVNDLSGTGVDRIDISLFDFGVPGGNDDAVIVNGSAGDDSITASSAFGVITVSGLTAELRITGTDAAGDTLTVNGLGGDDTIDGTGLEPAEARLFADGGVGDDVLLGGDGDDVLSGGDGADVIFTGSGDNVAFGGAGDDVLRGEEGDDVLDGGDGDDVLFGNAGDDVLLNGEVVFDE
jgi:Ca2+-binding RTX toxin-like protein